MNSTNHEKLYCTEFVSEALKAGGLKTVNLTPYRKNTSLKKVHNWLKIRDRSVIQGISLIQLDKHVATLSKIKSMRELQLYIAIREELHRRYTTNQRLGNIYEWTGFSLKFRASVEQFHVVGLKLHQDKENLDWKTAKNSIQQLASTMLGPFAYKKTRLQTGLQINPVLPCAAVTNNLTNCQHP
jgi:diphthamide synthase subunit DPH2